MGYRTRFTGQFRLDKQLTLDQYQVLMDFAETDHRNEQGVPDIWCDWVPTKDGRGIQCANNDMSFYEYDKWLEHLIERFLKPWGITVNGAARWQGDETGDTGTLTVHDNVVSMLKDSERDKLIAQYVTSAIFTDGGHHKQWYLMRIAELLDIDANEAEEGVAP